MKFGIVILSGMAGIWAGWSVYAGHLGQWAYLGAAIIALVPIVLMTRRRFAPRTKDDARRVGRLVGLASLAEIVAIVVGIQVLAHAGRPDHIVCLIAAVVGLHFLPLARWIPMPKYYGSALALVTAACIGVVIPAEHRALFVASTASAILWLTALSIVLAAPAMSPQAQ
jgi:hypothetical protein